MESMWYIYTKLFTGGIVYGVDDHGDSIVQHSSGAPNPGHVARFPAANPTHRIFSCRGLGGWTMPRGRQVESYMMNVSLTGLASAWAMARRTPKN